MTTMTPTGFKENVDFEKQDKDLLDLAKSLELRDQQGKTGADQLAPATPPAQIEGNIELYKRLVRPTCFLIAVVTDWCNRRFLKKSFKPLSDDQIALVEPDMSVALKKTFDAMLPEIAKRNPEWFCLAITFMGIYAANTEDLPKPEPEAEKGKEPQKTGIVPAISTVEV